MSSSDSFKQSLKISTTSGSCGGGSSGGLSSVRSSQGFSGGSHCGRRSRHSSERGICHSRCGGFGGSGGSGKGLSSMRGSQGFSGGGYCGGRSRHNSAGGICHTVGGGLLGFGGGCFGGDDDAGFLCNKEKSIMQNLNDRLATYLDKVRSLEEENTQLESTIAEWYHKHGQSCAPKDYSPFYQEIDKLIGELISEMADGNKIILDINNVQMAADDIKLKYQAECGLRQMVEADLHNLHALSDKVTLEKSDLEMQYETLKEELAHLKKDHQDWEAKSHLQHQSSGDVTVEVNSGSGLDLKTILDNLRHEYEQIIEKNHREVEHWYDIEVSEVHQQVNSTSQETDCNNKEMMDLERQYQALVFELQSQLSIFQSLKSNLIDTEGRSSMQLQHIASKIEPVEAELASIKCEIQGQNLEYQTLLGIKIRLEREIHQYHQLLEEGKHLVAPQGGCGGDSSSGSFGGISGGGGGRQSYGGISQRGQRQSCDGISQGGGGRGGGGQSYGGISQGGQRQSCDGISQGGRRRGGGGGQSYGGISQGGQRQSCDGISQGGGRRGGGQSYSGISQGGGGQSCDGMSRGGGIGGRVGQSYGGISQGGGGQSQSSRQAQSGSSGGCYGQQDSSPQC